MFNPVALPIKRPLLSLASVAAITGESMQELVPCVEAGYLRLCFNIATPGATARAIRVSTASVAEYLRNGRKLRVELPAQVRAEIAEWFPALSPTIRTGNLKHLLACSRPHLEHLTEHRCLRLIKKGRFGPDGSALYSRDSVIEWLLSRRIT